LDHYDQSGFYTHLKIQRHVTEVYLVMLLLIIYNVYLGKYS